MKTLNTITDTNTSPHGLGFFTLMKSRFFIHGFLIIGLLSGSGFAYIQMKNHKDLAYLEYLKGKGEASSDSLKQMLSKLISALDRMAGRYESSTAREKEKWLRDSNSYRLEYKGIHALEWADESAIVRWINPMQGNDKALGLDLKAEPLRRHAIESAEKSNTGIITDFISLKQGGKGFLTIHPTRDWSSNKVSGYIVGVFKVDDLFGSLLDEGTQYQVRMAGKLVYEQKDAVDATLKGNSYSFKVGGVEFSLTILPKDNLVGHNSGHPDAKFQLLLFIAISLLLSGLFVYLDYYRQKALVGLASQKRADLRAKHLAMVVDTAGVGVTAVNRDGLVTGWNQTAMKMFEYREQEILGQPIRSILPEDKLEETMAAMKKVWQGESVHLETVRLTKSQTRVPIELTLSPIYTDVGAVDYISGIAIPMANRLKIQRELKEQVAFLNTTTLISYTDKRGVITYVNDLFCEISKFTRNELYGSYHNILNSGHHPKEFWENMWQTITSGKSWKEKVKNKASDGSYYWVLSTVMPRFDAEGSIVGYVSLRVDITEQKASEQSAMHASKLASIGELAAGVGHEINNPLAIVLGNLGKVKREIVKPNCDMKLIEECLRKQNDGIHRIAAIVNSMRTYARKDEDNSQILNVHYIIKETSELISDMYGKEGVDITVNLAATDFHVVGNIGKFQQVLTILLSNAKDALEGLARREIGITTQSSDQGVTMKVSDTGNGIPENIQDKIFDSFFTTKAVGKGTGIGLGVLAKIIDEMNGKVELTSTIGSGTTFSLSFPLTKNVPIDLKPKNVVTSNQLQGRALVVDDEEGIRELLVEHLEDIGLDVDEADDGDTAIEKVKQNDYDYICTDMKMPRVRGDQFIRNAREFDKGNTLYFIITGGVTANYSEESSLDMDVLADGYIQKPFTEESIYEVLSKGVRKAA